MNVITESKKGVLISSVKLIASSTETKKIANDTLGIEETITCEDVSKLNSEDYDSCSIKFVDGKAKVKIVGKGKFEGMSVCSGTKETAEVVDECPGPVSFTNDSWETIVAAVRDDDTSNYNVGDTKTVDLGTLGTHTVRISNKTARDGTLESETVCGFVIEFVDIITTHKMNSTSTNAGGWPASAMYACLNVVDGDEDSGVIYNALVSAIGDIIIDTKVVSSRGVGDTKNFVSIDKLYLLSPEEVYGTSFTHIYDASRGTSRQLDYYVTYENTDGTIGVTTSKYAGAKKKNGNSANSWWLRSADYAHTARNFFYVNNSGYWDVNNASAYGVSPAFRLG